MLPMVVVRPVLKQIKELWEKRGWVTCGLKFKHQLLGGFLGWHDERTAVVKLEARSPSSAGPPPYTHHTRKPAERPCPRGWLRQNIVL
jgi:hypothetical protein